jgi:hypothetical protein
MLAGLMDAATKKATSTAGSTRNPNPRSKQATRIRNGSTILPGVDGRSVWVKRAKELLTAHINDLGGEENCTNAEQAIIRRCVVLITELERRECQFALSEGATDEQLDIYARVASNLRRLLEAVGLQRRPREILPSVDQYLARQEVAE